MLLDDWWTTGDRCRQAEEAFAARVGATHAVAVNSCTAAPHLALKGICGRRGDLAGLAVLAGAAPGTTYELRLYADNAYPRPARSVPFGVT